MVSDDSKDVVGSNVRLMVVGSAPVAGHVISFMRLVLGNYQNYLKFNCYKFEAARFWRATA